MASSLNIPLTTLTVGTHAFGPASVADSDSQALLTIDRTVAGGFNSLTAAATAQIIVDQSDDGGATWVQICKAQIAGGAPTSANHPVPPGTSSVGATFQPGTGREARAHVVIAGTSVAVAGSLVTS